MAIFCSANFLFDNFSSHHNDAFFFLYKNGQLGYFLEEGDFLSKKMDGKNQHGAVSKSHFQFETCGELGSRFLTRVICFLKLLLCSNKEISVTHSIVF